MTWIKSKCPDKTCNFFKTGTVKLEFCPNCGEILEEEMIPTPVENSHDPDVEEG